MNWPQDFIETVGIEPYYHDESGIIYCGDCLEIMPKMSLESIDLITTDPAYESLRRWEGIGTTARMGFGRKDSKSYDPAKFFQTIPNKKLNDLTHLCSQLLKPNSHCYIMCDAITIPYFFNIMGQRFNCPEGCIYKDDLKPPFDNMKPLIWDKEIMGMGYHYRCQYEFVLMFDKGKRKLKDLGKSDILKFKKYKGEVPTQKPIRLFELLITQSSDEDDIILDPFLGSNTTGVASILHNRRYIGIEISEAYCKIAKERILREREQLKLIY